MRVGGGGDEGTRLEVGIKGKSWMRGIRQRAWYRVASGDKGRKLKVAIRPEVCKWG